MSRLLTLVLATSNQGKLAELRALLEDIPVELIAIGELLDAPLDIVEDGETFEENARIKAREVCAASGLISLADDSGLEVDALGGRPGVRSARFAHDRATDAENNAALLRALDEVEEDARAARFRCVLALATPWSAEMTIVEGSVEGSIARTPRGSGGFGYDPLFVVSGVGRAMAELDEAEKNSMSHRATAVRAIRPVVEELLERQLREVDALFR